MDQVLAECLQALQMQSQTLQTQNQVSEERTQRAFEVFTQLISDSHLIAGSLIDGQRKPAPLVGKSDVPLPTFSGKPNEDVTLWIFDLNNVFTGRLITREESKISVAVGTMTARAKSWVRTVMEGQNPPNSWNTFVALAKEEFLVLDSQLVLREQLDDLRQTTSVAEVLHKFRTIMSQVQDMSELDKVKAFMRVLKPEVRSAVMMVSPKALADAVKQASRHDRAYPQVSSDIRNSYLPTSVPRGDMMDVSVDYRSGAQFIPAQGGNQGRPPRQYGQQDRPMLSDSDKQALVREGRCFKCRAVGHVARGCLAKK